MRIETDAFMGRQQRWIRGAGMKMFHVKQGVGR